jgi:hypothetical protein
MDPVANDVYLITFLVVSQSLCNIVAAAAAAAVFCYNVISVKANMSHLLPV